MYLSQEIYNLIPCKYFPNEVTYITGQNRTRQKLEMLRYSKQIRRLGFVI